jgi:hypothetical protein
MATTRKTMKSGNDGSVGDLMVPRSACVFACPVDAVRFADEGEKNTFWIRAYDGGISEHWYWGRLAFDLEGITFASKRLPVLDSHYTASRVGFTTKNEIDEAVTFEGKFLSNAKATELRRDMKEGFPMQASLQFGSIQVEQVAEGATAKVNGRTLKGPGAVFRKGQVIEVSMAVLGAMPNTQSTAFAGDDTDTIEVERFLKEQTMKTDDKSAMTVETFQAEHADLYEQILAAGRAAGAAGEKERFAAIAKACGDDAALAADCFAAGMTVTEALTKCNAKLSEALAAANQKLAGHTKTPVDPAKAEFKAQLPPNGGASIKKFDETAATDAELEAHFAVTPELRDQFTSAKSYIAQVRHPANQ